MKTQSCVFRFSFRATLFFVLMNALGKTEKATLDFRIYKIWQILKRFAGTFRQAQMPEIGRSALNAF